MAADDQDFDENYEFDEDEIENWTSDNELQERPNCWSKCLKKVKSDYMIDPDNKKLRAFHLVVALSFYIDVIVTSLMIGNYDYQIGNNKDYLNHWDVYYIIILIQAIDIILNFIKIQVIDISKIDEPGEVAIQYIKGSLATDLIAVFPYNMFYPNYIFLRLIRARRYKLYQEYVAKWICETTVDMINQETVKMLVETFNLTLMLCLLSHFFACLWILMGLTRLRQYDDGWIKKTKDDGRQQIDFVSLYITSQYWVLTSYTSVGYGDITGTSQIEYLYQMLLEMLGIGIFGYMTGLIQTLFIGLGAKDLGEENQELVNLWLIKLDKAVPEKLLSKLVFEDVRQFYEQQFRHDASKVMCNSEFFLLLKPRLQKAVLDAIFQSKYELFADILDHSCPDFQRELVLNFEFRFHSATHPGQQNPNIFNPEKAELPILDQAFEEARYIHFLVRGEVHMMDHAGMYDYGIVQKGSYFGDISVILRKPNEYSYFYDPNLAIKKPLSLFRVDANIFRALLDKYPLEKDIWTERARKREEFFSSYKTLALVKMMKSVVKNPSLIRHNLKQYQKNKLSLVQRVQYFKEREIKLNLIRLFLRQYELLRVLRRKYQFDNQHKKALGGKTQNVHLMIDKALNVKRPKLYDTTLDNLKDRYIKAMSGALKAASQSAQSVKQISVTQAAHNTQFGDAQQQTDLNQSDYFDNKDKIEESMEFADQIDNGGGAAAQGSSVVEREDRKKVSDDDESSRNEISQFSVQMQQAMPTYKRDHLIIDPDTILNQRFSLGTINSELKSAEFGCVSNSNNETHFKAEHSQIQQVQQSEEPNDPEDMSQKIHEQPKYSNDDQIQIKEQIIQNVVSFGVSAAPPSPPQKVEKQDEVSEFEIKSPQLLQQQPQFEDESHTFIEKEEKLKYDNMSPSPMRYEGGSKAEVKLCKRHSIIQSREATDNLSKSSSRSSSSRASKSGSSSSSSNNMRSHLSSDFERDQTMTQGQKTLMRTKQFPIEVDNDGYFLARGRQCAGDQNGSDFEGLKVTAQGSAPQQFRGLTGAKDPKLNIRQIHSTALLEPRSKQGACAQGQYIYECDKQYYQTVQYDGRDRRIDPNGLKDQADNYKLSFDEVAKLFGYDYCKKTIFKELEEASPADQYSKYESMNTWDLEKALFENTNFIECVLNQYFLCKLARESSIQRKKNSVQAISRIMMMRHNKGHRTNIRSRDINHMDNIIDEYLSLDMIQKQILFNKHNLDFYFDRNKKGEESDSVSQSNLNTAHHGKCGNQDRRGNMQKIFDNLKKSKKKVAGFSRPSTDHCHDPHADKFAQHFEVNQKNIKLINYKENRLSEEVKVAIQIEQDCADQTQALKNQGIIHLGSVVKQETTTLQQQLIDTNTKFADYANNRNSFLNTSACNILGGRAIETDRVERRSTQSPSTTPKKLHDFPKKSVPSFFESILPDQQEHFLNSIEQKVNEYEAEKYRRFLEQSENNVNA